MKPVRTISDARPMVNLHQISVQTKGYGLVIAFSSQVVVVPDENFAGRGLGLHPADASVGAADVTGLDCLH